MKGNKKIIDDLNKLLARELTVINQYIVHAHMCSKWGYEKLHKAFQKRSIQEMIHAEKLIERILFLDGKPVVNKLNALHIGPEVKNQLNNDLKAEHEAIKLYNDSIQLAVDMRDNGTREMLEDILKEEEEHAEDLEAQVEQIKQYGLEGYLSNQVAP